MKKPNYYTVAYCAEDISCSRKLIHELANDGLIRIVKFNDRQLFRVKAEEWDRFVASREAN